MDKSTPPDPGDGQVPPEHQPVLPPGAIEFLTLGLAGAVALAALGGLGYVVDRWVGTSPLFTLVGLGFGVVVAVLMTIVRVRKYL
jgi:hypothetical protein